MPKTQEELNQLKNEYETLNNKLKELSENELKMVTGGGRPSQHNSTGVTTKYRCRDCGNEYICRLDYNNLMNYLNDGFSSCPKCNSCNCEILGFF